MSSTRPLQLWLALRIALAGMAPLAVVAALVLGLLLPQLRADLDIRYEALARAIVGQIETHLLGAGYGLRAIAKDFRNLSNEPATFWSGSLDAHAGTGGVFAAIYIIDSDDSVYAVGLPEAERGQRGDLVKLDLSKWAVLREARKRNEEVWSETLLSAVTGRLAVTLAIPMAERLLIGEIAIDRLSEFIGRPHAEGMVTMILDRRGQIIAHSQAALGGRQLSLSHLPIVRDALEGRFATRDFELDGQMFVGTPVSIPQFGWIVLVAQPRVEAFRPFLSILWVLAAGALVALPLTILVAWVLARGLARRIGRYAEQAHAIAEGDYDQPWPVSHIQEFDRLADDLDRMSLAIRQRERDLATSEARYRSVIGSVPVVIFQFDEHGVFTLSEGKGLARVGLVAGEAVGQSLFELYRDYPEICEHARRAIGGEALQFISRVGETFFDTHFNPARNSDGSIQVMGVAVDITDQYRVREALRESEARLRTAIENIPFDFFLINPDGRYALQNTTCRKTWGNVLGKFPEDIADDAVTLAHWQNNNRKALAGEIIDEEVQVTVGNQERYVHNIIAPIRDGAEIRGLLGINIDVTERKQAEEALRQANLVVENSPVMLFRWKAEEGWPVVFVSHNVKQIGYITEELLDGSIRFASLVYPDDLERIGREVREYFENGVDQFQQEYRIVAKDGTVHWVDDRTVVERNSQGEITHYQGIVIDITERKRAEEALRQSRNLLQAVLDTIPARVFWKDHDSRYLGCNQTFALDAGANSPDEIIGRDDYQMSWREQADLYRSDDKQILESDKPRLNYEEPQTTPDGHRLWLQTSKVPLRDADGIVLGILGTYQDITERKRVEEALLLTQFAMDHASDSILWVNDEGNLIYANNAACASVGYTREELLRMKVFDIDPDFPVEGFEEHKIELQRLGSIKFESRHRTKDGRLFPVEVTGNYLEYKGGFLACAFDRDITERKQAETKLRESEARFRRLAENAPDMIYRIALPEGCYEYASPASQQITGYTPEEFYQSPQLIRQVIHPDWQAYFAEEWPKLIAGQISPTYEYQIVHKSGQIKWLYQRNVLVRDSQGQPLAIEGIVSDITERKLLEEQIETSLREKEGMLKEIHHRVKNNLQLISSLLDLQAGYIEDQVARDQLRESRNRVRSMALIHERLYQVPNLARIGFAEYTHDLAMHLIRAYATPGREITARVVVTAGGPVLSVEMAVPCGLIINELVTNALKHAFATRCAGEITLSLDAADGQWTLRVRDDGIGFPAAVDFRHTSSLGLTIVMTLVKQLKGTIGLYTEAGTEFVIVFPDPHHMAGSAE